MKKLLMTITSIALLLTLSLSLVACSSYGKIEKALEEIGYAKVESSQEAEDLEEESEVAVTMHVFSNTPSPKPQDRRSPSNGHASPAAHPPMSHPQQSSRQFAPR